MKKYIFFIIACISVISCSEDELDKTIFIPDENDQRLPAYTEWGYNSFGAKYERAYFLARYDIIPCKITYRNNSISFLVSGVYDSSQRMMSLSITFPSERVEHYSDLLILHQKNIDLSTNCTVKLTINGTEKVINVTSGSLNFKRAQLLKIDDVVNRVILSGTFEFQFLGTNSFPESFSNGRFDFGITSSELYSY